MCQFNWHQLSTTRVRPGAQLVADNIDNFVAYYTHKCDAADEWCVRTSALLAIGELVAKIDKRIIVV
jgi:hypothetical protein